MKPFTFKIGGKAGTGIASAGLILSKIATRSGYYTFDYIEYPSIIRGGHNVMQITVDDEPTAAQFKSTDFLVALDQETVDRHAGEISEKGILLYDSDQEISVLGLSDKIIVAGVPLSTIAREMGGNIVMRNTAAIGAALNLLGGSLKHFKDLLAQEFSHKNQRVLEKNYTVAEKGFDYADQNFKHYAKKILAPKKKTSPVIVINGNEAAAMGSIAGGMQFAAIYPMTPTSNILHVLAPLQKEFGFIYKQPEDEISAINMAIGASFAGARSMTATSGGGFCLMSEGFGLAGMTESSIVIIMGQRTGPATGLPTWTEQGDARFVLHAHQGDFPRIVLAPGDIEEVFHFTMEAFNLADKYQTPVIVLVDKQLCESHQGVFPFDYKKYKVNRGKFTTKKINDYARYAFSEDGISLRAPAGSGNHVIANSDEHDINGYSNEESQNRKEQMEKRMRKLMTCEKEDMPLPILYGPKDADLTIVSWGSNKGAIMSALKDFKNVNFLQLTWLNPFPSMEVAEILRNAKKVLNIECNFTAQVGGLITEKTGIVLENNFLKYDGRPFYPEEIKEKINELLR
jgi:2-oxoglutarate ferredoxin oxidoreductase subunit alpha